MAFVHSKCTPTLSAELRNVINERNILTTKTKQKVMSALEEVNRVTLEDRKNSLRGRAIQEILTSEVSYLHQLELIMKFFMDPMKERNLVNHSTYLSLFGNIETIYNVNGELLKELKRDPENIAPAFLKLAPFFKLYSVYAYDYKQILQTLQDTLKTNSDVSRFIQSQECRPEVGTKLLSLLITPIQRIPRYRLLLKEVLTHTSNSHPDFTVLKASLAEVERAAEHVNRLVQDQENMQKMIQVQRSLCGGKPRIVAPGRKLLKEGVLMKVSPEGRKAHSRYFFLFNDMIMYCKLVNPSPSEANSLRCCCILPLKNCSVDALLSRDMFNLTCHDETLILYSSTAEEGEKWVTALKSALQLFHEHRQTLRKDSSSRRPMRPAEFLHGFNFDELTNKMDRKRTRLRRELDEVYHCDEDTSYQLCASSLQRLKQSCQPSWKRMKLSCLPIQQRKSSTTTQFQQPRGELKDSLYPLRSSIRRNGKQHATCTTTEIDVAANPTAPKSVKIVRPRDGWESTVNQSVREENVVTDPTLLMPTPYTLYMDQVPKRSSVTMEPSNNWPLIQFKKVKLFLSEASRSIYQRLLRRNSI